MLSAPNTSAPADGSRTVTIHDIQPRSEGRDDDDGAVGPAIPDGTLRLRGGPRGRPRVAWDERVVDNENCGRKKSKSAFCCIYHKPKEFDESSDEESSSNSDSDSSDDGRAKPHHHHFHRRPANDRPTDGSDSEDGSGLDECVHEVRNGHKPNAYESQPSQSKKGKDRG